LALGFPFDAIDHFSSVPLNRLESVLDVCEQRER
jgi:hypothetical protein